MDWVAYTAEIYFLTVLKLEVQDQGARRVSFTGGTSLLGLQTATLSLYPHTAIPLYVHILGVSSEVNKLASIEMMSEFGIPTTFLSLSLQGGTGEKAF